MTAPRHVFETFIRATPEAIWAAITDPAFVERSFPAGAVASGVEESDPPRRLVLTWRVLHDAAAEEPPSRVEWEVEAIGDGVTRVTTVHRDLGLSPQSSLAAGAWWPWALGSLKSSLETGDGLPGAAPMAPVVAADEVDGALHRRLAVDANNATWGLLGQLASSGSLTPDEIDDLLGRAYAAAYHWRRAAGRGPENAARAAWLVSRCHAVLGHGDVALLHAERCLAVCADAGLVDFDLAYAHEARARALACLARLDEAAVSLAAAWDVPIADPEDAAIVTSDLASEPWYGLTR